MGEGGKGCEGKVFVLAGSPVVGETSAYTLVKDFLPRLYMLEFNKADGEKVTK